jgi:hypothetical protein
MINLIYFDFLEETFQQIHKMDQYIFKWHFILQDKTTGESIYLSYNNWRKWNLIKIAN